MERLVVLQLHSAMKFGLLFFFTDSISTYTVLEVLVYSFLLVRMCTHLLFHLQFTVIQYAITGRVHVRFCSVFLPSALFSILHALTRWHVFWHSSLYGLPISLLQKIYTFIFFYVQHWLLLFELPSQLLPCPQQMQRMMGMVRKEQCLSLSCSCLLSRWVLVLSPCHCWRVGFGASLGFVFSLAWLCRLPPFGLK